MPHAAHDGSRASCSWMVSGSWVSTHAQARTSHLSATTCLEQVQDGRNGDGRDDSPRHCLCRAKHVGLSERRVLRHKHREQRGDGQRR